MSWQDMAARLGRNKGNVEEPCLATIIATEGRISRLVLTFHTNVPWLHKGGSVTAQTGHGEHGGMFRIARAVDGAPKSFKLAGPKQGGARPGVAALSLPEPEGVLRTSHRATPCKLEQDGPDAVIVTLPRGWSKLEGERTVITDPREIARYRARAGATVA